MQNSERRTQNQARKHDLTAKNAKNAKNAKMCRGGIARPPTNTTQIAKSRAKSRFNRK
ncbi:MAG: hypothetical protein GX802_00270, partial [Clostridiales bacterium]|nr:hypothetical protein [Clostridiales bacterium]